MKATPAKSTKPRGVSRRSSGASPPNGKKRVAKKPATRTKAAAPDRTQKADGGAGTQRRATKPSATRARTATDRATAAPPRSKRKAGKAESAAPRTKSRPRTGTAPESRAAAKKPAAARTRGSASKPATSRAPGTRDKLAVYRSKRDFGITPEPQGKGPSKWKRGRNPFFVIQKHAASRLHYDFRLEVDGVLKSWAVPKGPSMDPADKRLAVETEDHPMDYADFEGIIPKDEYGGGTVIVWDAGPYRNLKRKGGEEVPMQRAYEKGTVEIWLEGRKIRGGFALVRSGFGGNDRNWLLIKMKDAAATRGGEPIVERGESVMSGRTIEEVASDPKKTWSSNR